MLILGAAQVYADVEKSPFIGLINLYKPHYYLVSFLCGYYVFSQSRVQSLLAQCSHWLGSAAAAALIAYTKVAFGCDYSAPEHLALPPVQLLAFLVVLAIVGLGKRHLDRTSRFASYMSRSSYGLYVLHYAVLVWTAYLLTGGFMFDAPVLPPVLVYLGTALSVFGLTPLLYELIRRIPYLRWCILGLVDNRPETIVKDSKGKQDR